MTLQPMSFLSILGCLCHPGWRVSSKNACSTLHEVYKPLLLACSIHHAALLTNEALGCLSIAKQEKPHLDVWEVLLEGGDVVLGLRCGAFLQRKDPVQLTHMPGVPLVLSDHIRRS